MLFVGAGASKPFGTPVLAELTRDVKSVIEKAGYGNLWEHVYDSLKKASKKSDGYFTSEDEIDMEVVLSVFDFIMDPVAKMREHPSPLYAAYGLKPYPFYLGIAFSLLGFLISVLLVKDTSRFTGGCNSTCFMFLGGLKEVCTISIG